jgi:IS66 C-terminal element
MRRSCSDLLLTASQEDGIFGSENTLIQSAKLNNVDPQVWLADLLARIADHPITDLTVLLPWNWKNSREIALHTAAAA